MGHRIANVLLIDDDSTTNYLHKRVVLKTNLCSTPIVATDGEKGLEALLGINNSNINFEDYVLIFLDLNMPVMDGWNFLKILEKIKEQLKFKFLLFVVSSSINRDDIDRAEKNYLVAKYLKKPMNIELIENMKLEFLLN